MAAQEPTPHLGSYYAECCLADLYVIATADELAAVWARCALADELGPLGLWDTLAEAVAALQGQLPPAEEAAQLARLGWVPPGR